MNELAPLKQRFEMIVQSNEAYPVDFDEAWQWIGYTLKANALRVLLDNFEAELYFSSILMKSTGGRPSHRYFLTVDCFKAFCMMAGTERGKEARRYYLAVEKAFLAQAKTIPQLQEGFNAIASAFNALLEQNRRSGEAFEAQAEQNRRLEGLLEAQNGRFEQRFERLEADGLRLGKAMEEWNTPEAVKEKAVRMGVIPADGGLTEAQAVRLVRAKTRAKRRFPAGIASDFDGFVEANLVIGVGRRYWVTRDDMYQSYRAYMGTFEGKEPLNKNKFVRCLNRDYPEIEYKQRKIGGRPIQCFFNVKLKPQE